MLSFRDLASGFRQLNLDRTRPVIVHASLSAFGEVRGGIETLLGAVLMTVDAVMAPTFTYNTMVIPETGPEHNGLVYGSGKDLNRMATPFRMDMPADRLMGALAETLRHHPNSLRSNHPILSFAGVNVKEALDEQTLEDPLAPISWLVERGGWVLLLGVDHTVNTSIHYAEKLAGRRQFLRWAITGGSRIAACPGFPGCSNGFSVLDQSLREMTREVRIGNARVRALPLRQMVPQIAEMVRRVPDALLCENPACERCSAIRSAIEPVN